MKEDPIEELEQFLKKGDADSAVRIADEMAKDGDNCGYAVMGVYYEKGEGVPVDIAKALEYYLKADDIPPVQYQLGKLYQDGELVPMNTNVAYAMFKKAVDNEYPPAYAELAHCYMNGYGVETDFAEARRLAEVTAGEDQLADNILGILYAKGFGVEKDAQKAIPYLERASGAGHVTAMALLGEIWYYGDDGIPADKRKAFSCFSGVSEDGDPDFAVCSLLLAEMLLDGDGCKQDIPRARRLLMNLAKCDDPDVSAQAKELLGTAIHHKTVS